MITRLKLYVNKDLLVYNLPYIDLLNSLWGTFIPSQSIPYGEASSKYGFSSKYFEIVDQLIGADYYLLPHDYWYLKRNNKKILQKMIVEAERGQKKILIDASGDVGGKIKIKDSLIFRLNQYKFSMPDNEITVPFPCEDLLESYYGEKFSPRLKFDIPVVGFVGWGRLNGLQRFKSLIKNLPLKAMGLIDKKYLTYQKGIFWRKAALHVFQRSSKIKSNFIVRYSYSGHIKTLIGDPVRNRREFVENMFNSDYSLVVRGDANASARFYETLSLGRIPVFINTACVLPLETMIDYKDFCIFIDYTELIRAADILRNFHNQLTSDQFIAMQEKARYIFKNFLRYDAFSKHLYEVLRSKIKIS